MAPPTPIRCSVCSRGLWQPVWRVSTCVPERPPSAFGTHELTWTLGQSPTGWDIRLRWDLEQSTEKLCALAEATAPLEDGNSPVEMWAKLLPAPAPHCCPYRGPMHAPRAVSTRPVLHLKQTPSRWSKASVSLPCPPLCSLPSWAVTPDSLVPGLP